MASRHWDEQPSGGLPLGEQKHHSRNFNLSLPITLTFCVLSCVSCSTLWEKPATPNPPLRIVVAPILLDAAISESTQIHTFDDAPSPESEPVVLRQLEDEIQTRAQRFLTEHLAQQEGFDVLPFQEARRTSADISVISKPWTEEQLLELGRQTNADFVISGRILDYGRVRWQYSMAGFVTHAAVELLVVGFATGWNPVALGAFVATDFTTDIPIWFGGGYVFGWAFRPVRIELSALQLKPCLGEVWTPQVVMVRVPGQALDEYPPEEQKRKEVQLEANLKEAMADLAETAGQTLRPQPCTQNGTPTVIRGGAIWKLLDLLY